MVATHTFGRALSRTNGSQARLKPLGKLPRDALGEVCACKVLMKKPSEAGRVVTALLTRRLQSAYSPVGLLTSRLTHASVYPEGFFISARARLALSLGDRSNKRQPRKGCPGFGKRSFALFSRLAPVELTAHGLLGISSGGGTMGIAGSLPSWMMCGVTKMTSSTFCLKR